MNFAVRERSRNRNAARRNGRNENALSLRAEREHGNAVSKSLLRLWYLHYRMIHIDSACRSRRTQQNIDRAVESLCDYTAAAAMRRAGAARKCFFTRCLSLARSPFVASAFRIFLVHFSESDRRWPIVAHAWRHGMARCLSPLGGLRRPLLSIKMSLHKSPIVKCQHKKS